MTRLAPARARAAPLICAMSRSSALRRLMARLEAGDHLPERQAL